MNYFCNEALLFWIVCFSILLACFLNNFLLKHSLTLYEEISRSWSSESVKQIEVIYFIFTCSILLAFLSYSCLSKLEQIRLHVCNHPRGVILLNYICLELTLKAGDRLKCTCGLGKRVVVHFLWCAMFAPSMLLFKSDTVMLSLTETMVLLITLTSIAFFWNIQHQRFLMCILAPVILALHIFLATTSILLVVLGYPHNIFGFTVIIFALHFGFLFYAILFLTSTQVLMEFTKKGTQDILENVTDFIVCTMHLFARISIFNSFNIVLSMN